MTAPSASKRPLEAALSVYVHVPFCLHRCTYCDFVTRAVSEVPRRAYLETLLKELDLRAQHLDAQPIATVFFGGGTPSLLKAEVIGELLAALNRWGGLSADAEITVECNPGAAESGDLAALADAGVTRLSIGVQSLQDERLRRLDRIHDADSARRTLREVATLLQAQRIESASMDLIYGCGGDSQEDLRRDIEAMAPFDLPHLSAYALTVETGTPLAHQIKRGIATAPDDATQAAMLSALPSLLAPTGLSRYEVSNFARPGHTCRHNLATWRGGHYLALGAGGHGFLPPTSPRDLGRRYGNHPDERRWREAIQSGVLPEALSENIDAEMHLDERVLMGLRLREGLDLDALRSFASPASLHALKKRATRLRDEDRGIELLDGRIRVNETGLIALDRLVLDLLS